MGLWFSPDSLAVAASDVASIGNSLRTVHGLATLPTTAVAAAGLDEVSAAIAALFGSYGKEYQALSAQAAVFHDQFVQALTGAVWPTREPSRQTSRRCKAFSTRSMRRVRPSSVAR